MKNSIISDLGDRFVLNNCSIYYHNQEGDRQTVEEIFNDECYRFVSTTDSPFIIDAGANIGIATLYFKKCYPKAKILCFEPDPNAFLMLQKNVFANQLQDVTLVNAALSNIEGKTDFFGQLDVKNPDIRGNSIIAAWGMQRATSSSIKVNCVKLSSYINSTVDFLKLDIEGAEQQVLKEISGKIPLIKQMGIEVHQANQVNDLNSIATILNLLIENKFNLIVSQRNIAEFLPEAVNQWKEKANPALVIVKAEKC
jgi:FkbM family methyltransferase